MMRWTLLLGGVLLLMLTGWVSAARRESVEPYYLEFTIQHMVSGNAAVCRLFYYHFAQEACDFGQPVGISSPSSDGRWRALADADGHGGWRFLRASRYARSTQEIGHMNALRTMSSFAWSPDDRWMVISGGVNDRDLDIFRLQVASGEFSHLTVLTGNEFFPAWSADSQRIAFNAVDTSQTARLLVMGVDGGDVQEPLPGLAQGYRPAWSPDGAWLAFESSCSQEALLSLGAIPCDAADTDLYLLRLSDGHIQPLVTRPGDEYAAAWSPDGEWVAYNFRSWNATNPQIFRVRPDGSDVQALTGDPGISYSSPMWIKTPDLTWRPIFLLTIALVMGFVAWRMPS